MVYHIDSTYFSNTKSRDFQGYTYEGYISKFPRSTMILFSQKTRTPLAALILKPDDPGCRSLLTSRPGPPLSNEAYFQGMLDMPNQPFTFNIVNLNSRGLINFNILHTPYHGSEVDPGPAYGINQVNELHPNEGYKIPCDQRTGRKMVLVGKTKVVQMSDGSQETKSVKVEDDESKVPEEREGLYFYLSVVADNSCSKLVDKFKEGTVWKVCNQFVRKVKVPILRCKGGFEHNTVFPLPQSGEFGFGAESSLSRNGVPAAGFPLPQSGGSEFAGVSFPQNDTSAFSAGFSLPQSGGSEPAGFSFPQNNVSEPAGFSLPQSDTFGSAAGFSLPQSDTSIAPSNFDASVDVSVDTPASEITTTHMDIDIGNTQATELHYGKKMEVKSSETGKEYAYEYSSSPAVMCLSIATTFNFFPLYDMEKVVENELTEWIDNQGKSLIEGLTTVFKSDKCVIDLEKKPDTVVCTCGHSCMHSSNVKTYLNEFKKTGKSVTCPLCRDHVVAIVKLDGSLID